MLAGGSARRFSSTHSRRLSGNSPPHVLRARLFDVFALGACSALVHVRCCRVLARCAWRALNRRRIRAGISDRAFRAVATKALLSKMLEVSSGAVGARLLVVAVFPDRARWALRARSTTAGALVLRGRASHTLAHIRSSGGLVIADGAANAAAAKVAVLACSTGRADRAEGGA